MSATTVLEIGIRSEFYNNHVQPTPKVEILMQTENLSIAVCILFFEKIEQTIECIKSFLASEVNIYILNNGSSNKSRNALGEFCKKYKQIKIFDSDKNLGVAVGRNYLINHTVEDWLLFVDNDIRIKTKNWLKRLKFHLDSHENIEVFIPRLYNKRAKHYKINQSLKIENNIAIFFNEVKKGGVNCFPGGASFINRKLFERLGLYDNEMFIGLEDYELSIRGILQEKPIKATSIKDIVLIHDHRLAKKKEDRGAASSRYNLGHIKNSLNIIKEKHNVLLEGDWIFWSSRAENRLLHKNRENLKKRLKKRIPEKVKRVIKKYFFRNKKA